VYSDDGLGATDSEEMWREFMQDFKSKFELEEKEPDYFLGCGIIQDESGAIHLDPSKYIREMLAKYDMDKSVCSPLPMPAGTIVYMPDDEEKGDEQRTNLFQQITGSILYCSLMRPELQFYAAQLCKVMSRPTEEHMGLARQVLMYLKGTLNDTLTFRPAGCDGFTANDVSLLSFSDSDWACAVDTRRSHGCHVVMFGGAAIAWRSKTQKSVMLSTAAAEYYEGSEACREIAFVRSILEDFYETKLAPTPLYIDNTAAISMGKLPQFTERQKHIPIRICHLKECVADGLIELRPIPTRHELADIGTKALAFPCFKCLKEVLIGKVSFFSGLLSCN